MGKLYWTEIAAASTSLGIDSGGYMKKIVVFLIVAVCALSLITGCSKEPEKLAEAAPASKADTIQFSDDQLYAVAWVGYDDLTDLPDYLESYVDSDNVPVHYFSKGEYYLVIPRYTDMYLKLYKNDMETSSSTLVFEEQDCKPFLIQCNISDIFPDATISFAYQNDTVEFTPFISLKDGSLEIGDKGLNLTK